MRSIWHRTRHLAFAFAIALSASQSLPVSATAAEDLTDLGLEELMNIRISLPSRKEEPLFEASAAVYVIGREDIEHSTATTIPDLLRMVPGLQVAQMEANKWAITSRGFNGRFARHMLVQVDGRTVYSPLFSGVYWENQDLVLEDIERIEVVRGPGSTMWGANAVNGIINVVTRSAHDTLGTLITAGAGNEERAFASVRHGVKLAQDVYLRIYYKGFDRDSGTVDDSPASDDWNASRAGFRMDWIATGKDTVTLQGDYHLGEAGQLLIIPDSETVTRNIEEESETSGANLLFNWHHTLGLRSDFSLRTYYDYGYRSEYTFGEKRHTFDVDFQHRFPADSQEFIWGAAYRLTADDLTASSSQSYSDESEQDALYSAFIQDEITVIKNRLRIALGSKFEHNDYTGLEIQPSVRGVLTPTRHQTLWSAVSRAVRTPSRLESSVHLERMLRRPGMEFFGSPTLWAVINGDPAYGSESLIAYEAGYRIQATRTLNIDLTGFYNDYDHLQTVEPRSASLPIQFYLDNKMQGESFGAELSSEWHPFTPCTFQLSYAYIDLHLKTDDNSRDIFTAQTFEDDIPHHQGSLRSRLSLPFDIDFDTQFRYVDPIAIEALDRYLEMDLRLCWHATDNLAFTLAVQNLLDSHHYEYGPSFLITTQSTEVDRSVYAKVTWLF
jgi:iron complex outermembrane receptor protein